VKEEEGNLGGLIEEGEEGGSVKFFGRMLSLKLSLGDGKGWAQNLKGRELPCDCKTRD